MLFSLQWGFTDKNSPRWNLGWWVDDHFLTREPAISQICHSDLFKLEYLPPSIDDHFQVPHVPYARASLDPLQAH